MPRLFSHADWRFPLSLVVLKMRLIIGVVATAISLCWVGQVAAASDSDTSTPADPDVYPARPIRIVVPFGAGGGSDTFVRIIQKSIEDNGLLSQPLVIINVPGAGGAIGSRQVLEAEPDGYTLMCLHEGIMTTKYAGRTVYGPEAFQAIAGTGEVGTVIAVADRAKYTDLAELMDDAAARPNRVVFAANIGAPSHFAGLMLEDVRPGARFRYTQTGGGAKRFAALVGGHIDVSSFSLAEYMQFKSAGLRALAYCGQTRHPAAPDLPTATEQGFDVVSSVMQFWWAPKHTPPEKIKVFADVLRRAMQTTQVQTKLDEIHTDRVFLDGAALQLSIAERESRYSSVVQRELVKLPNFPLIVLSAFVTLALVVAWEQRRSPSPPQAATADPAHADLAGYAHRPKLAMVVVAVTACYIMVLQANWIDFRVATAVFIVGLGTLLADADFRRTPVLAAVAILMSVGLHYLLTNVFAIALP